MKRTSKVMVVVLSMILLYSMSVSAQMRKGAITLNPQIGGYMFEGNQNIKTDVTYGLGVGYSFDENWAAEGNFNYVDSDSEAPTGENVEAYVYRLDALYHMMPDSKFVPYLAAGIGAIRIDGGLDNPGTDPLFNYGAGIKYFITKNLALRGDVRHIITDDPNNNLIYTFGLSYLFGGEEKKVMPPPALTMAPAPPPAPKKEVAPPPAPKEAPAPPPPAKPAPEPVAKAAPEPVVVVLDDIHFDFDKASLTDEAKTILKKNVATIKANAGIKVRIEGHACAHGPEDYNLRLSEKRANAVKEYLVNSGVPADRLSSITYGETRLAKPEVPTPQNKNSAEAKENRRVHFEVVVH